jgi:hypothetical protein
MDYNHFKNDEYTHLSEKKAFMAITMKTTSKKKIGE